MFEITGAKDVNNKRIENEADGTCGINDDETALLDADRKSEPDEFNGQCIELDDLAAMEIFDLESTDFGDDDDELSVFEAIGLKDINDKCIATEDEGACGINDVEAAVIDSDT